MLANFGIGTLEGARLRAFPRTLDHDIRGPPAVAALFMRESLDGGARSVQGVAQLSLACVARTILRGRIPRQRRTCRGRHEGDESHNYRFLRHLEFSGLRSGPTHSQDKAKRYREISHSRSLDQIDARPAQSAQSSQNHFP